MIIDRWLDKGYRLNVSNFLDADSLLGWPEKLFNYTMWYDRDAEQAGHECVAEVFCLVQDILNEGGRQ
jgi:hypothetical protein